VRYAKAPRVRKRWYYNSLPPGSFRLPFGFLPSSKRSFSVAFRSLPHTKPESVLQITKSVQATVY
jgi:hypothetical protein